jgi:sigma-54 specific flagellar transcriptional regulator A
VAQALHDRGPRRLSQFVPINCGAVPKELLESELFGHRKGSFTGALSDRIGRFELAHGGTLFLDEVGDLPADMQVKLLRVLQERSIVPLGSNRAVDIDVRIVAATHRNMEAEVSAGRFREDLYYRLNVLPVHVAALRERTDDIRDLLQFYADRHRGPHGQPIRFRPGLLALLMRYAWPGNVRDLCNLVDRFATFFPERTLGIHDIPDWLLPSGLVRLKQDAPADEGSGDRSAHALDDTQAPASDAVPEQAPCEDAPEAAELTEVTEVTEADSAAMDALLCLAQSVDRGSVYPPSPGSRAEAPEAHEAMATMEKLRPEGISLKQRLHEIELSYIEQALERTSWNVSQTAKLLSLQRTTLIEKINRFGLNKERAL